MSDYQAIQRVLSSDHELKKQIDHALKGKVKDLRQSWRAFDSDGQLKRWRAYLAGENSKPRSRPRTKRSTATAAKKHAVRAAS